MKKYLIKLRKEEGFTLIEMLIVIMIVSALLLLVVTNIGGVEKTVRETTDLGIIQTVESQIAIHKMKENEDITADALVGKGYITEKQLDAYNKAKIGK